MSASESHTFGIEALPVNTRPRKYAVSVASLLPRYVFRNASWARPDLPSTGSTWLPPTEVLTARNTALRSSLEISDAPTLGLAITFTSPVMSAACGTAPNQRHSPATASSTWVRLMMFMSSASPWLEVEAGLEDQRLGIRLESCRIDLWVETIRVRPETITVHEVAFHLHVHETVDVDSAADRLVVVVPARQGGVEQSQERRGDRVVRVVGAELQPFHDPIAARHIPGMHVGDVFRIEVADQVI